MTLVCRSQPSSVILCIQNSVFSIRITSLYGSQTSPMVFCIQNSAFSSRIASLYGSQPSSVDFACKRATFGSELQVSMGPSPHLWILHLKQPLLDKNYKSLWVPAITCGFCMQNSDFRTTITSLYGSQTSPMFFAFKTKTLAPELQVSIGPSSHLRFMPAKQRLLDQKYKSPWVPAIICGFVHSKQRL